MKIKEKIAKYWQLLIWFSVIIFSLFPITHIGWLVHYLLQEEYGLKFSWIWAKQYWIDEMLVVAFYGVTSSIGYWLFREKEKRQRITAFLLGLTAFWQWLSGFFDFLWFFVHRLYGFSFPSLDTVWWWSPFSWLLNLKWTTRHQIIYCLIMETILFTIWLIWYSRLKRKL